MRVEGAGAGTRGAGARPQAMGSPARGQARGSNGSRLGCVVPDVGHDASARACYDASATAVRLAGSRRVCRRRTRRLVAGVGGPGRVTAPEPGNRSSRVSPGAAPSRSKIHRHTAAGLAPITRPGRVVGGATPHTIESAAPWLQPVTDDLPAAAVDDRFPGVQRPPAGGGAVRRGARPPPVPRAGTAASTHGQRFGGGGQRPPVVSATETADQRRVVDLPGVVRVAAVQPRVAG